MKLAELQAAMSGFLTHAPENGFAAMMHNAPGLDVYQNNYRSSLLECLRDTYEKSWLWLGDEGFNTAARTHIDTHPPHSWTLDDYGQDFIETLSLLYPDDPEIPELAWLEWHMRRAFAGADVPALNLAEIGDVAWDEAHFLMHPSLVCRDVATNAPAIWSALDDETSPPAVQFLHTPAHLCVWRKEFSPSFRTLEAQEARLLNMALGGMTFGAICATLAQEVGEEQAAQAAGAALGQWLRDGWIAEIATA
jgi:hypothetical protein